MLKGFKTLFFWLVFMLSGMLLQGILLLRFLFVQDQTQRQQMAQRYRLFWASVVLRGFLGVPPLRELKARAQSLPQQFILIANHRSNLDPLLVFVVGKPLVFLSKKSVLKTPVVGWWMKLCGDVPVDRGEKASREQSLGSMRERLARGDSLLIFPEGTRQTDPATPLGPFKDGAFQLASQSGVPIVALVLHETDRIWRKGQTTLDLCPLRFSISDAIPADNRDALELKAAATHIMHTLIQSHSIQN